MYSVTTGNLNLAVKRNLERFPTDFMFQLTKEEFQVLILQNAISKKTGSGGIRKLPYAFAEHGVLMLSSILNSKRAIQVNIQIMRIYTRMRELMLTHKDILLKLEQLENQTHHNTEDIQLNFGYLKKLLTPVPEKSHKRVGYKLPNER